ncbi:UNVERIFIED_ORG: hypothetical protein J2W38_006153 [Variovorax paradoxus]|nr:hypothetical protein [Variovorax paradoxus]
MRNRIESLAVALGNGVSLPALRRALVAVLLAIPAGVLACTSALYREPTASLGDFYETDALVALVTAHPAPEPASAHGITRLRVVRWLRGTGPGELDARGFPLLDEHSPMFNSCRLGTLYPGKPYIVVLDSPLSGDVAHAYSQQRAVGKLVVQTAWESP